LLVLSASAVQAQTLAGSLKCMHDAVTAVPALSITATFYWTNGGVKIDGGQKFTCDATKPLDEQPVSQPAAANGWRVEFAIVSPACGNCEWVDSGTFDPSRAVRFRSRFDSYSMGTGVYVLKP
jgi:hypothetical protein